MLKLRYLYNNDRINDKKSVICLLPERFYIERVVSIVKSSSHYNTRKFDSN